jgi:hypothetical protein
MLVSRHTFINIVMLPVVICRLMLTITLNFIIGMFNKLQTYDDVVKEQFYEGFTDNFLQKRLMIQVDAKLEGSIDCEAKD